MKSTMCSVALVVAAFAVFFLRASPPPQQTGPATEKRFPPLKIPPGFKATLFACDPLIEYPSVISAGPRAGAIFVAVDYVSGLRPDMKRKSEIRLIEDTDGDGYADKATVYAKDFNSIQGLAFHDGYVYVMHAPFLTKLRDTKNTGIANERKDLLTGLGLKPEDNPSRLHCANGVTVGHDGWLYLALGDNGIDVPRPEGDRLIYNGGGILRCRPDGRDLHIFSTGLRNIYDIALDADLNVFTRDNENDGGTYMIRVCHCFHGSDHGYPYDYYERPDHAMKPIGDFGLGSSAGGVCYLETQFPPAYRGNLFFCEWGKSVVRYELKRSGSGFAPVKEIEFASGDSKDIYPFKPTDVVVQRDGTLMIADYADGQAPKRGRGRIYHVASVGPDSNPVKKKPKSDLEKLNSQSYFERCEAQAAYERRGDDGRNDLGDAFRANRLGPLGFGHALLALSKGTEGTGLGDMQVMAIGGGGAAVRAQAIRIIADLTDPILVKQKLDAGRGDAKIARLLATLPDQDDPRIRLEIAIALGRLRWADAPEWLRRKLTGADETLQHAAMQTLRRADNWPAVLKLLEQPADSVIRRVAVRALADQFEPVVVDGLIDRLETKEDTSHRECAELLARVYKKPGPWKYWGYRPGARPVNTVVWEKTEAIEKALDRALANADREARLVMLKRMQREKVPVRVATLGQWLKEEHQTERAAVILASLSDRQALEVRPHLEAVMRDNRHSLANRKKALEIFALGLDAEGRPLLALAGTLAEDAILADVLRLLAKYRQLPSVNLFASKLASSDADVRAAAIEALGELGADEGRAPVLKMLQDGDVRVRRAAAGTAGKLNVKPASPVLLKLLADSNPDLRLACLDSLKRLREPAVVPLAIKALNDHDLGPKALECIAELGGPEHARTVVDYVKRSPTTDNLATAVRGLSKWNETAKRKDLDTAIAELHGAGGLPIRWQAKDLLQPKDRDKLIESARLAGSTPRDWRTEFAAGAEGRIGIGLEGHAFGQLWFAYTDIEMPSATPVEFLASSRGTFEVWLNGQSVHRRAKSEKYQVDSDRFSTTLAKGVNRVLVQAGGDGSIEFHLRFRRKSSKAEHEKLTQAALSRPGNAERGKKLFFDKEKTQCIKCHRLGNEGETIAPDLTGVGARFARIHIIESILEPSRTIAPSYGTYVVTLKNGKSLNGVKVAETEKTLTFADNQGIKHVLARTDIDEERPSAISTMPDALEQRMTADEFVDLIAFLTSQKEKKSP